MYTLIIKEKHGAEYRLNSYEDFYKKLPKLCDCHIYGKDSENYDPEKTIYDIIEECPKKPDVIFVMAPLFQLTDNWHEVKAEKYFLVTDSFDNRDKMQKEKFYRDMDRIEWSGIFHHYLQSLEFMKSQFKPTNWHYFPNWASDIYDYEKEINPKTIDYFMSGKYSSEYAMRKVFHQAFKIFPHTVDNFSEKELMRRGIIKSLKNCCWLLNIRHMMVDLTGGLFPDTLNHALLNR